MCASAMTRFMFATRLLYRLFWSPGLDGIIAREPHGGTVKRSMAAAYDRLWLKKKLQETNARWCILPCKFLLDAGNDEINSLQHDNLSVYKGGVFQGDRRTRKQEKAAAFSASAKFWQTVKILQRSCFHLCFHLLARSTCFHYNEKYDSKMPSVWCLKKHYTKKIFRYILKNHVLVLKTAVK